jgi:anhydro-N-acetylmuramic acid kinase
VKSQGLEQQRHLIQFKTIPYEDDFKQKVLTILSKQQIALEHLVLLNPWIGLQHANMVKQALADWEMNLNQIDLIASHGQTIYHAPKSMHPYDEFAAATLQIGDGDHLAVQTGIITISDFRQKHIAAGGEGAPLAMYGDYLLCSHPTENRLMLNIGGIANYTFLPAGGTLQTTISTDTGPGNTLMDALMRMYFNQPFDKDGEIAKQGQVHEQLLAALRSDDFFSVPIPKSIGQELFNIDFFNAALEATGTQQLSIYDLMATLNKFTAITIAEGIQKLVPKSMQYHMYTSGGGMHNQVLMEHLYNLLPNAKIQSTAAIGIDPDAKEAILFALLANEFVAGSPLYAGSYATKIPTSMGKISFPY